MCPCEHPRPSMRTLGARVVRGRWRRSVVGRSPMGCSESVALLYWWAVRPSARLPQRSKVIADRCRCTRYMRLGVRLKSQAATPPPPSASRLVDTHALSMHSLSPGCKQRRGAIMAGVLIDPEAFYRLSGGRRQGRDCGWPCTLRTELPATQHKPPCWPWLRAVERNLI
jgi:hypothetical protein